MFRPLANCALPGLLLCGALAAPALADPVEQAHTATQPEAKAADAEPAGRKKVCKSIVYTGSRLPAKKICKTKEEWDALAAETQADLRDRQRDSRNWKPGSD